VAGEALECLQGIPDTAIGPEVLRLFKNHRGTLGEVSAKLLGELKEQNFPEVFAEKMRNDELTESEKEYGFESLGNFSDPLTVETLAKELADLIEHEDTNYLTPVIQSLAKILPGISVTR